MHRTFYEHESNQLGLSHLLLSHFFSTVFVKVPIVQVICAIMQDCAAPGCGFQACSRNGAPFRAGRSGARSRRAVQPRASNGPSDKAGPKLFGIPLQPAQMNAPQHTSYEASSSRTQPQQSLNGPLDALRAHGNSLKHVAAGIAISAALFAGVHHPFLQVIEYSIPDYYQITYLVSTKRVLIAECPFNEADLYGPRVLWPHKQCAMMRLCLYGYDSTRLDLFASDHAVVTSAPIVPW